MLVYAKVRHKEHDSISLPCKKNFMGQVEEGIYSQICLEITLDFAPFLGFTMNDHFFFFFFAITT